MLLYKHSFLAILVHAVNFFSWLELPDHSSILGGLWFYSVDFCGAKQVFECKMHRGRSLFR